MHRVSTAEQGQSGLGLETQRASVQAFAASQGWMLVAEYEDVASGKDDRRPGFRGSTDPLPAARRGAGGGAAGSDHSPSAHTVAAAGGRCFDPGGRHARRGRPDDAGLRGDGAEGAVADQRANPSGTGGSEGAWEGAGRGPGIPSGCWPRRRACRPGPAKGGGAVGAPTAARAGAPAGGNVACGFGGGTDRERHPHTARRDSLDAHHGGAGAD